MENIEIIIGTYENIVLGFKTTRNVSKELENESSEKCYSLDTSFTDDNHRGALRCLAVSPSGVLVSCSTDDSIRLHSLHRRKEIGGCFSIQGQ